MTEKYSNQIEDALNYVRGQLGKDALDVVHSQKIVQWEYRSPIQTDYDDEIYDLLEEYGEEHGLSEEWWSTEMDFDDILVRL